MSFSGEPTQTREAMWNCCRHCPSRSSRVTTALALFAHRRRGPSRRCGRIGCVGYCMSGPFSFAMACAYPERIKAAASIYGVRLFGPGSPAEGASKARGELYFACAELDEYAPAEMVDGLERYLDEVGANARVERLPGRPSRLRLPGAGADSTTKAAAERHWERLHALFAATSPEHPRCEPETGSACHRRVCLGSGNSPYTRHPSVTRRRSKGAWKLRCEISVMPSWQWPSVGSATTRWQRPTAATGGRCSHSARRVTGRQW